jgi:hypothetical protein
MLLRLWRRRYFLRVSGLVVVVVGMVVRLKLTLSCRFLGRGRKFLLFLAGLWRIGLGSPLLGLGLVVVPVRGLGTEREGGRVGLERLLGRGMLILSGEGGVAGGLEGLVYSQTRLLLLRVEVKAGVGVRRLRLFFLGAAGGVLWRGRLCRGAMVLGERAVLLVLGLSPDAGAWLGRFGRLEMRRLPGLLSWQRCLDPV